MLKFFFALMCFLIPLMNSGLFMLGLSLIVLFFCLVGFFLSDKKAKFYFNDYILIGIYLLYSIIGLFFYKFPLNINTYVVAFIYLIVVYLFINMLFEFDIYYIGKILRICIIIYGGTICFQHVYYFISGSYIDIYKILSLGHSESRYISKTFHSLGLIRPTSFFSEPSNASAVVSIFSFCYVLILGKLNKYSLFGFISSMLTLSSAGAVIGAISLFITIAFDKNFVKSKILKYIVFTVILYFIFHIMIFTYDRISNTKEYDMILSRSSIFYILYKQNILEHIFGNGINILSSSAIVDNNIIHDYSFRDSGFLVNLYYSFGLLNFVLFFVWLKVKIKRTLFIFLFLVVIQSKFDYLQPMFWMGIFVISISHNKLILSK